MEDNEKLLEEIMRDAEVAGEPGELAKKQVLHKGDDEMPSPMITAELKSAGYVYIYDTRTGDRSKCNRNMLVQHLKKKRDDGSTVFTTKNPGITPKKGTFKCMLHPDDPNRKHYDELGLPTCRKDNLNSRFQVMRHMQKRHKLEWQTIEQERIDAEKQEEKEFRRQLVGRAVEERPLYVSDKDKAAKVANKGS